MAERRRNGKSGRREAARQREQYWRRVLKEQRTSGLGHIEFCRKNSISQNSKRREKLTGLRFSNSTPNLPIS